MPSFFFRPALMRLPAFYATLIMLYATSFLQSQTRLVAPESITNRWLGYLSDVGAVAWNPAMLGMRSSMELLFSTPLRQDFSLLGQYSFFAKLAPLAVGYTLNADSSIATGEFYAGLGFNVIDDILWLGASGRVVNPGNLSKMSLGLAAVERLFGRKTPERLVCGHFCLNDGRG